MSVPRYYLDACIFIHLLEGAGHKDAIAELFERAEKREIEIFTSILSITEVAYCKKDKGLITDSDLAAIDALWHVDSPLELYEVSEIVARAARRLIRQNIANGKKGLKSHDAIHLATALHGRAKALYTYDTTLKGLNNEFGILICEPPPVTPSLFISSASAP